MIKKNQCVCFFSLAGPNVQVFTLNSSQSIRNPEEKLQKGLNPTSVQKYVCGFLCACLCPISLIIIIINEPPRNSSFVAAVI